MKNYLSINGNRVELSDETTRNLIKQIRQEELDDDVAEFTEMIRKRFPGIENYMVEKHNTTLVVGLPGANTEWTFAIFDAIKEYCEVHPKAWPCAAPYLPDMDHKENTYIGIRMEFPR